MFSFIKSYNEPFPLQPPPPPPPPPKNDNKYKKFCFVISSYNNEKNIVANLESVIKLNYTNWRVIYINDCSTDKTEELFFDIIKKYRVEHKFTYIKNEKNMKQAYSKYMAYQKVNDLEIVCILDGDDWLSNTNVLNDMNKYYTTTNYKVITTNFIIKEQNRFYKNEYCVYSDDDIKNNNLRYISGYRMNHLKTGYGYLFKSIPEDRFKMNDEWLSFSTDLAEIYSAIEFSNGSFTSFNNHTYIYNKDNSVIYENSWFNNKDTKLRAVVNEHIKTLSKCKYILPKTYIINIPEKVIFKCNMIKQMNYIEHNNYEFIIADTPENNETVNSLYDEYIINLKNKKHADYHIHEHCRQIMYIDSKEHCRKEVIGLISSVFKVLNEFVYNTNDTHCLIVEDDIYSMKNFKDHLIMCDNLSRGKDLIYLGYHFANKSLHNQNSTEIFNNVKSCNCLIYGGYAIIVSREMAKYILTEGIKKLLDLNMSWDLYLNYIRFHEEFTFYTYHKQLFIPEVRKIGIQSQRNLDFYKERRMNLTDYYL